MPKRVRLLVSGRVQGVWFRGSTKQQAEELGLTGWCRNLPSGEVEIVAEGEDEGVDDLVAWCWIGPRFAEVRDVKVSVGDWAGEFVEFGVVR